MSKLSTKLKEEFFALLPPTIFFFVALHIVAFVRVLMLKGTGISPLSSMSVAVAALILGKAVLIADMLPMINRFPNKPLIYNVAWKTLIYLLMATLIHYLDCRVDGRQRLREPAGAWLLKEVSQALPDRIDPLVPTWLQSLCIARVNRVVAEIDHQLPHFEGDEHPTQSLAMVRGLIG